MKANNFKNQMNELVTLVNELDGLGKFDEAQKNRRLIESLIAAKIIAEPNQSFQVIDKVSQALVSLLKTHAAAIQNNDTLNSQLNEVIKGLHHHDAFGRLVLQEGESLTDKSHVDFIINLLNNSKDLPIVVHLHALLGTHLVRPLLDLGENQQRNTLSEGVNSLSALAAQLVAKTPHLREALRKKFYLYEGHGRGRHESKIAIPETTKIGIYQGEEANLEEYSPSHVRAADKFTPDLKHPYYAEYIQNSSLPFIAGPSGHAGILLRTATMLGQFSAKEMKQYNLAVLGMIVGGGMHSFNEIMIMFKQLGFEYNTGDYQVILDLFEKNDDQPMELVDEVTEKSQDIEALLYSFNTEQKRVKPNFFKDGNPKMVRNNNTSMCRLL